jgi:aspartokinase
MVSVAKAVEKLVKQNPSLEISLSKGIISYSKLARYVHAEVEKELGKKANDAAITVAIKRLRERAGHIYEAKKGAYSALELNTSSSLMELTIGRSGRMPQIMKSIYEFPELEEGCIMHAVQGNNQTTFVFSSRLERKMRAALSGEKAISEIRELAQLSIKFDERMFRAPGFLVYVLKELAWNNINIVEIVSTYTELIVIIKKDDLMNAYAIAQGLLF